MTSVCSVCCDSLNRSTRKPVPCAYCDLVQCRQCTGRYLLESSLDPHCMGCRKPWNREFLDMHLTKAFVNGPLKTHSAQILFEREQCLLPQTQIELDRRLRVQEIYRLLRARSTYQSELFRELQRLQLGPASAPKPKQSRKCPVENCRGFLSDWNCSLCKTTICSDCGEPLDGVHVCDPGTVETFSLLKKDTKGCPGCGEMIFKISGCSQMWCPSCHVAFDWYTLEIETGRIHNPHYYEYRRLTGALAREPGDVPCGGRVSFEEILARYGDDLTVMGFHRLMSHIELFEFTHRYRIVPLDNLELRIRFLTGSLTPEKFKKSLQESDKAHKKTLEIRSVLQMFVDTVNDILRDTDETHRRLSVLREYFNDTMRVVASRYASTTPRISDHLVLVHIF